MMVGGECMNPLRLAALDASPFCPVHPHLWIKSGAGCGHRKFDELSGWYQPPRLR